jgi:hypothetical protein
MIASNGSPNISLTSFRNTCLLEQAGGFRLEPIKVDTELIRTVILFHSDS